MNNVLHVPSIFYCVLFVAECLLYSMEHNQDPLNIKLAMNPIDMVIALEKGDLHPYRALDAQGNTLMHYYAQQGNVDILKAILPYYPIIIPNYDGQFPTDIINQAMKDTRNARQRTALPECLRLLDTYELSEPNVEKWPRVIQTTTWYNVGFIEILKKAIKHNKTDIINELLQYYTSCNHRFYFTVEEMNCLYTYVHNGSEEVSRLLKNFSIGEQEPGE